MALRLFGVHYADNLVPTTSQPEAQKRYEGYLLFRQGIAELLNMHGDRWRWRAGMVATRLLRPALAPGLFELEAGRGLTYLGEMVDNSNSREQVRLIRQSKVKMQALDIFYAVTQGDNADAWSELQERNAALH